jgi:hypothetical protein
LFTGWTLSHPLGAARQRVFVDMFILNRFQLQSGCEAQRIAHEKLRSCADAFVLLLVENQQCISRSPQETQRVLPMRPPGRLYKKVFQGLLWKLPRGVGYEDSSEVSS